jgi:predicted acetyltransferase
MHEAKSSTRIVVVPATREQEPIVANLLELYAHDFSEFHDVELGEDGRFVYPDLNLYWSEADRHPFLVRVGDKLAGVILVSGGSRISGDPAVWDMAEFFIVRGYRRRGIGSRAAQEIWRRFPGRWEVRVMEKNETGRQFWARAVAAFAGEAGKTSRFEKDGGNWRLFAFVSAPNGK